MSSGSAQYSWPPVETTFGPAAENPLYFGPQDPRQGMIKSNFLGCPVSPLLTPASHGIFPDWRKGHVVKREKEAWNQVLPLQLC